MRILHVIPSLDPETGGPANAVPRLAAAQRRLGADAEILTYRFPERDARTAQELAGSPGRDVPIHWVDFDYLQEWLFTPRARRELRRRIDGCDVMVIHNVWDPICLAAGRVAHAARVPYVVIPHGGLDPWTMSQRSWRKKIGLAMGYRSMLERAAFLQVLSKDEHRLLQPLELRVRTEILPNGIFLEEIEPLPDEGSFYEMRPELERRPYILFLGRLHHMKGLDVLIRAFEKVVRHCNHVDLVVAGPDGGAESELVEYAEHAGLQQRVHRMGPLYGKAKLAAMVDAAVFCLPSRREGFSIAVLEAMAAGCPVVLSDQCRFPAVTDVAAGLVVPLDAEAVATALNHMLQDREAAVRMGARGAALVREKFTWPAIAERSLECYRRLVLQYD